MKKKILLFGMFLYLGLAYPFTLEADEYCGSQSGYELYNCRVEKICTSYKSPKPFYVGKDYENADEIVPEYHNQKSFTYAFESAQSIYRENMGNIYKCGIIQSQRNTLDILLEFIEQESGGKLSDTIGNQIKKRLTQIERKVSSIGCSLTDEESIQNKLNILGETSFEACRYISYLEYTKGYYENLEVFREENGSVYSGEQEINYDPELVEKYPSQELPKRIENTQNRINEEIAHTYKVFPIAYHAYSEYENNFPIHFLLELIKADFLVLRTSLYQSLMPLAQLGLKVINAMSY